MPPAQQPPAPGASPDSRGAARAAANAQDPAGAPFRIDLPEPVAGADHRQGTDGPEAPPAVSALAPLLGYWRQLDEGLREPDFAPGGQDLSLLVIRPTQRSLQIYRSWGAPSTLVVAADLRATFDAEGTVRIEETPSRPSRFLTVPLALPGGGGRVATPPRNPLPVETRWSIESGGLLRLDGRLYRRIDRDAFDQASQARAPAGIATPQASPTTGDPGGPAAPSGGVDFFGARVRGGFVCFVCDISLSMRGDKMEALKRELIRTVRALREGTHWQVVFFDDSAHVFRKGWAEAGSAESEALLRKVDGVGTGAGTDPTRALEHAFTDLDPVPHEIFLLTDGQFGSDARAVLARLNGGADRSRVHTLAMGDDADTATLRSIAADHGGTFTHVPAPSMMPPP